MLYVLSIYLLRRLEIRTLILSDKEDDDTQNFLIVDKNNNPKQKTIYSFKRKKND